MLVVELVGRLDQVHGRTRLRRACSVLPTRGAGSFGTSTACAGVVLLLKVELDALAASAELPVLIRTPRI